MIWVERIMGWFNTGTAAILLATAIVVSTAFWELPQFLRFSDLVLFSTVPGVASVHLVIYAPLKPIFKRFFAMVANLLLAAGLGFMIAALI
jgi:hypothetical protein